MSKLKNLLVALCLLMTFIVYFYPVPLSNDSLLNYTFIFANIFLFFFLGILLYVSYSQVYKAQSVFFLIFLSLLIQLIQSQFENRQFDLDTVFYNSLGSIFGAYFFKAIVQVNYLIYLFINSIKSYPLSFHKQLIRECDESIEKAPSLLKDLLRFSHFSINKYLNEADNKLINLKYNHLGETIFFPIMSGNIFKHIFYGTPEPDTSVILSEATSNGDTVFDLGAHYGFFSLSLSSFVGDSGKVFSFEPTRSTFELLQKNTGPKSNITSVNQGFFSVDISLGFNNYGNNYSGLNSVYSPRLEENLGSKQSVLDFITLDSFVDMHGLKPNLIKMDCESSEHEILKGSKGTIEKYKPKFVIEFGDIVEKDLPRSREVLRFLEKNSYVGFRRFREGYKKVPKQDFYPYFNALFIHESEVSDFFSDDAIMLE